MQRTRLWRAADLGRSAADCSLGPEVKFDMRPVDLYHHDRIKGVDLSTICDLMAAIERGEEELPDFELAELDLGPPIVFVGGAFLSQSGAHAWVLHRARRKNNYYLAIGESRRYLECIFYGAPERIRACCLLSLNEAVPALEYLLGGDKLPCLHWVSQRRAFDSA
jgi:hypothetical protein